MSISEQSKWVHLILQVRVTGYTNTHDGYCSGAECEYEEMDTIEELNLQLQPSEFRRFMVDCVSFPSCDESLITQWFSTNLAAFMDKYYGNQNGSMYCTNDPVAESKQISVHDFDLNFSDFFVASIHFEN